MDPVNSLSQISRLLRRKLAEKQIDNGRSANTDPSVAGGGPGRLSAEEVKNQIRNRIQALDPQDREGRQAAQIFVESILTWEFGDAILEDPQFSELSREVQHSIVESNEHWPAFQAMLRSL